jgi:hypothetical protein
MAHQSQSRSLSVNAKRNCNHRKNLKLKKMHECLLRRSTPREYEHLCWTKERLNSTHLVFDGGGAGVPELEQPPKEETLKSKLKTGPGKTKKPKPLQPWESLRVLHGGLWIADTVDCSYGITYSTASSEFAYTRIPRKASLEFTRLNSFTESTKYCEALLCAHNVQRRSIHRGNERKIYCDDGKYCCLGPSPRRAGRGVRDATYHKNVMPSEQYDFIVEMMKRTENALTSYVCTDAIRDLNYARRLLNFKTIATTTTHDNHEESAQIFAGIAIGKNVHLRCHIDDDFTYSVASIHLPDHKYTPQDKILAYFCFPRLGIAVPLRPGDILIFNPSEPHALSSRHDADDTILCVSMYLKTAVVGLNDNSLDLTRSQVSLKNDYRNEYMT